MRRIRSTLRCRLFGCRWVEVPLSPDLCDRRRCERTSGAPAWPDWRWYSRDLHKPRRKHPAGGRR